jgi:hypothetical protein
MKFKVNIEFKDESKNIHKTMSGASSKELQKSLMKKYPEHTRIEIDELTESVSNVLRTLTILEGKGGSVTIEKSQGEFRVPAEDGYEDGAYYTSDKEDAIGTAKKVFGNDVAIKFRSVSEFVGGKYDKYRPKEKKVKESLDEGKDEKIFAKSCHKKDGAWSIIDAGVGIEIRKSSETKSYGILGTYDSEHEAQKAKSAMSKR